MKKCFRFLF